MTKLKFTGEMIRAAIGKEAAPVSRETIERLQLYDENLMEWAGHTNLIARSTLDQRWQRHYEDSLQLFSLLPAQLHLLMDLGSGAGFPGMVLAILLAESHPDARIILIDSTAKKTRFLSETIAKLSLTQTFVETDRVEQVKPAKKADVITARALSPLPQLLTYAAPLLAKDGVCLFPKGKRYREEIEAAEALWQIQAIPHQSHTDEAAAIIEIHNILPKKPQKPKKKQPRRKR